MYNKIDDLKRLKIDRKWTNSTVARSAGISPVTLSRVLDGKSVNSMTYAILDRFLIKAGAIDDAIESMRLINYIDQSEKKIAQVAKEVGISPRSMYTAIEDYSRLSVNTKMLITEFLRR